MNKKLHILLIIGFVTSAFQAHAKKITFEVPDHLTYSDCKITAPAASKINNTPWTIESRVIGTISNRHSSTRFELYVASSSYNPVYGSISNASFLASNEAQMALEALRKEGICP